MPLWNGEYHDESWDNVRCEICPSDPCWPQNPQHGYDHLPVWVTEYMGGPWWDYESQETIAAGVWEWMLTQPRIERACWFPARWAESWTDPGGVGWLDQRLLDDAGELTDVGAVYAGLGE